METEYLDCDVLVIGAGVSGCALTAELVKNGMNVTLVESGSSSASRFPNHEYPAGWWMAASESPFARRFETVPQSNLNNRTLPLWVGIGGGGTGNINACLWVRGRREDYERDWSMWPISDIEESFRAVESTFDVQAIPPSTTVGCATLAMLHNGGFSASGEPIRGPCGYLLQGSKSVSSSGSDCTGWSHWGVDAGVLTTTRAGRRVSPWEAFIAPILHLRPTCRAPGASGPGVLTLRDSCAVHRILLELVAASTPAPADRREWRAVGVEVLDAATGGGGGVLRRLLLSRAGAEVAVCAGALLTPQLLLLSGLGPAAHLRDHGVEVRADVPAVGEGLQDHVLLGMAAVSRRRLGSGDSNGLGVHGFARCPAGAGASAIEVMVKDTWDAPDVGPFVLTAPLAGASPWWRGLRAAARWLLAAALRFPPLRALARQSVGLGLCLTRPASRGVVRLASADPTVPPAVDPAYLSQPADWHALREGLARLRAAQQAAAAAAAAAAATGGVAKQASRGVVGGGDLAGAALWGLELQPGWLFGHAAAEAGLRSWIRACAMPYFHWCGSCRMGGGGEEGTVVDARLRVHRVAGLRVADASVAPAIPAAPVQAMAAMVGHRAARILLASRRSAP